MDIDKIRTDTLHCQDIIHFNNAGASLPTKFVNEAIIHYLTQEETIGGYELEAAKQTEIAEIYDEIAKLIHCDSNEIALTDNATTAFNRAIFSIDFKAGDTIITSELEYGNNFLNYLRLKKEKGINIKTIPGNNDSPFDLEEFEKAIDNSTKLVAVTHMPTNSGAVVPIEAIGQITKAHDILYLVDTCQSIGHYPTFVDKIGCDFLTATGRKYLRGPRGVGFLYVNKNILNKLEPFSIEMTGAEWKSIDHYQKLGTIKMFEGWEKPYSLVMGLSAAVKYANNLGIENIWKRVSFVANDLRTKLQNVNGVTIYDGKGELSGIVSITKNGVDTTKLQNHLRKHKINTSISPQFTSLTDMQKKNLMTSNRLSLHYYNTTEEIDKVVETIDRI